MQRTTVTRSIMICVEPDETPSQVGVFDPPSRNNPFSVASLQPYTLRMHDVVPATASRMGATTAAFWPDPGVVPTSPE